MAGEEHHVTAREVDEGVEHRGSRGMEAGSSKDVEDGWAEQGAVEGVR